jgi:hypothetical protein
MKLFRIIIKPYLHLLYYFHKVTGTGAFGYKIAEYELVETVQAVKSRKQAILIKAKLRKRLTDFENEGNCLVIAHFNQGVFIRDLHIPHISPVGGYDDISGTVTMLDVDPPHEHPYKISFETFYKGISSNYHNIFKPFGFGSGGYIFIKLSQTGHKVKTNSKYPKLNG